MHVKDRLKIIDDVCFLLCTCCNEWKTLDKFQDRKPPAFMNKDSQCRECKNKLSREYDKSHERIRDKEQLRITRRNYYLEHREKLIHDSRIDVLKRKFNLTEEEFNELAKNGCMICGGFERLAVDHDHETNQIRGILCLGCNTALGNFKDSSELLQKAIAYLEKDEENAIRRGFTQVEKRTAS